MRQIIAFADPIHGSAPDVPMQILTNTGDGNFCLTYHARPNCAAPFANRHLHAGDPRNNDHMYPCRVRQWWEKASK